MGGGGWCNLSAEYHIIGCYIFVHLRNYLFHISLSRMGSELDQWRIFLPDHERAQIRLPDAIPRSY